MIILSRGWGNYIHQKEISSNYYHTILFTYYKCNLNFLSIKLMVSLRWYNCLHSNSGFTAIQTKEQSLKFQRVVLSTGLYSRYLCCGEKAKNAPLQLNYCEDFDYLGTYFPFKMIILMKNT